MGLRGGLQLYMGEPGERHHRCSVVPPPQYYSLSNRTGLYALEAFQRANGPTLGSPTFTATGAINRQINATASISDGFNSAPSSSRSQFAAGVGIIHRF